MMAEEKPLHRSLLRKRLFAIGLDDGIDPVDRYKM